VLAHELVDERVEPFDAVLRGAAIEDLRAPCVPGGEVAQRALALVLMLDLLALAAACGQRLGFASARLDRGLLSAQMT
jgi:hypothetical protein